MIVKIPLMLENYEVNQMGLIKIIIVLLLVLFLVIGLIYAPKATIKLIGKVFKALFDLVKMIFKDGKEIQKEVKDNYNKSQEAKQ